jgi:hypothetical protein
MKTWHYVAIGGVVLVGAYIVFSPKSTILKSSSSSNSGWGSTLTGAGNAASGFADLWGSVSKTFGGGSKDAGESNDGTGE